MAVGKDNVKLLSPSSSSSSRLLSAFTYSPNVKEFSFLFQFPRPDPCLCAFNLLGQKNKRNKFQQLLPLTHYIYIKAKKADVILIK